MQISMFKRVFSMFMALALVISVFPFRAHAEEDIGTTDNTYGALEVVQEKVDSILIHYLGKSVMTHEEIDDALFFMDWEIVVTAWQEIHELKNSGFFLQLSEEEETTFIESNDTYIYFEGKLDECIASVSFFADSGGPFSMADGRLSVSWASNRTNNSIDSGTGNSAAGTMEFVAWSSSSSCSTNTITIENVSQVTLKISFYWEIVKQTSQSIIGSRTDRYGTCSLGDTESGTTYTATLLPGGKLQFSVTGERIAGRPDAKLSIKELSVEEVIPTADITFQFDSALGSVSADGTAVTPGETKALKTTAACTLLATPSSGCSFVGWTDTSGKILFSSASYSFVPGEAMTVKAIFASSTTTARFQVGTTHLFENLTDALSYANGASGTKITLAADGILPAGNYTIPSGVTLLIPFDSANTLYTTQPGTITYDDGVTPTAPSAYRTLTMASGANIIVNGVLSVSGKHCANQHSAAMPTGPQGFITMKEGSNITVNGTLYAWGYIVGEKRSANTETPKSGTVTINGTAYECFQVTDFRGGDATTDMVKGDNVSTYHVFPLSQYYLQNVQVPMALNAGASEYGYLSLSITLAGVQSTDVPFIGSSGMFRITEGSVTKDYDEQTDRLIADVDGKVTMSNLKITLQVAALSQAITIDSAKYVLPITNNMTINVSGGSVMTLAQDIALYPGSIMNINEGASVNFAQADTPYSAYVYDSAEWGGYVSPANSKLLPIKYAYDKFITRGEGSLTDAKVIVNGTVDATNGYLYTTSGGAQAISEGTGKVIIGASGTQTVTYQITQYKDGNDYKETYHEIPITPAKLTNADGSTMTSTTGTYNYDATAGAWRCESHTDTNQDNTCDVCNLVMHTHSWQAATCTTPKTCSCGATEGEALGHSYNAVVTAPTCTAQGYTTHTCSACGDSYVDTYVDATGHTEVVDAAVAPTCTTPGKTEGSHCFVCSTVIVAQEVVDALGHTEVVDAAVAATCTETGLTEGKHCSVCGTVLVAQTVVPAGHTEETVPGKAATCTETGLTDGAKCSVCGETLTAQEEIPALGHTEETIPGKAATCTETGLTEGKHCSVCNKVLVAQETVDALGHTEVIDEAVAATCTETGLTEGKHCSVCNEVLVAQTVVDALGHTEVVDAAVAPDCANTGLTEGKHCSVCNEVLVAQTVIDALGHKYEAVVTAPTCTTPGYTSYTCSVCGDTYNDDEQTALGHRYEAEVVAPTCIKAGYTKHTCTGCGDTYTDSETPATGEHSYKDSVCTNCGATSVHINIVTDNMELGNSLALLFWVKKSELKPDVAYEAVLTRTYANGSTEETTVPMSDWIDNGTHYQVKYDNFAAKEMTDKLSIKILMPDGTIASNVFTDSIREYATFMIDYYKNNSQYREFVTAMVDMLNYGAAAQKEFKYNTSDLANSTLTPEYQALGTQAVTPEDHWTNPQGKATSSNLELVSNIVLHIWFKGITPDMYAVTSFTEHYGNKTIVDTVEFSEFTDRGNGVYSVPVDELVVADGGQVVTCTVYNADGSVYATCTESVESYIYVMLAYNLDTNGLYEAAMKFITSSYNYFH